MIEIHPNRLWIGSRGDLNNPRQLFDAGIAAVIDLAADEPVAALPRGLVYHRVPVVDSGDNDPALLLHAVQCAVDILALGFPALIACSAGMSRSPAVAAFALAAHLNRSPDGVLAQIAAQRSLEVHPSLWAEIASIFDRVRSNAA